MINSSKKITIILCSVLLLAGIYEITSQYKIKKQDDELSFLQDKVSVLEKDKNVLEEKVRSLEDDLADVQHFDNDANLGKGFSSDPGSVSFTGNVYQGTIDGDFNGWDGGTIFKLTDGSIWQQASYAYTYHYSYMPSVIIYSRNGITYMKVEDVDDVIPVKRLR